MKKVLVAALVIAAMVCASSCSKGGKCKCTTTTETLGQKLETTETVLAGDDQTCSDVAKKMSHDLGELGSSKTTCKPVND